MKQTVLAILVAIGLVGAAAETVGARRSGDGMLPTHSICDCYDFAIPVGSTRVATSGGMNGWHVHVEARLRDGGRR